LVVRFLGPGISGCHRPFIFSPPGRAGGRLMAVSAAMFLCVLRSSARRYAAYNYSDFPLPKREQFSVVALTAPAGLVAVQAILHFLELARHQQNYEPVGMLSAIIREAPKIA